MENEFEPLFVETLLLIARFNGNFLELASLLRQLYETSHHDFKTLISIPQLGPRKGYYLVEIDKAFGGNEHLRPRLNKIGWTKLQLIVKHVTPDNREDLLKLAQAHTAKNLERIMHGVDPIVGGRSVLLVFTAEQFAAFSAAILAHGAVKNGQGFIDKEAALVAALEKNKE
jgi:hypothetical protein